MPRSWGWSSLSSAFRAPLLGPVLHRRLHMLLHRYVPGNLPTHQHLSAAHAGPVRILSTILVYTAECGLFNAARVIRSRTAAWQAAQQRVGGHRL
jgi:hypothetical protein